eukprot:1953876-Prymnesium_polylepis.1
MPSIERGALTVGIDLQGDRPDHNRSAVEWEDGPRRDVERQRAARRRAVDGRAQSCGNGHRDRIVGPWSERGYWRGRRERWWSRWWRWRHWRGGHRPAPGCGEALSAARRRAQLGHCILWSKRLGWRPCLTGVDGCDGSGVGQSRAAGCGRPARPDPQD